MVGWCSMGTFNDPWKRKVSCSGFLPKTKPMQQSGSHYNAVCSNTCPSMQPLQCDLHFCVAEHQARTDYARNDPNRARRTHEVPLLSSLAAATLHRKTQGFVLRLPPQNKAHATVRQPLQCGLQQHVPIHAAITMRFAFLCCRTPSENRLRPERSKPHPPHTRGTLTFIAGCSHFTRKNARFRAPASSRKQTPCNSHAAITLRFATTRVLTRMSRHTWQQNLTRLSHHPKWRMYCYVM